MRVWRSSCLTAAIAIIAITFSEGGVNALQSNPPESPQILSDTTDVCTSSQGRTSKCEVELDVPASCIDSSTSSSSSCPIVFFFHGAGGNNDWFARTSNVHDKNVIGVYPQGEDGWNTGPKDGNQCTWDDYACTSDPDEQAFIAMIIAELRNLGANGNIYLIGNSNGAALSHKLAANAGDDLPIKGIVTKVTQLLASPPRFGPGELNYNQPGSGGRPISVLNLMGTEDGLIPYEGGSSSVFGGVNDFELMSALESMATWAHHNGCSTSPPAETTGIGYSTNADPNGEAIFYDYQGCPDDIIVEHYALLGAGHSFGAGAALNGVSIDYDLAYQFIFRVEALDGSGGGGGGPTQPPQSSTPAPSSSPFETPPCQDDPLWHGKFSTDHTCDWIAQDVVTRCGFESSDGTLASDGCKETCGVCDVVTISPTSKPTDAVTLSPTTSSACQDDSLWHGKFSTDHTCDWVAQSLDRCGFVESSDGTLASDACKETCGGCDVVTDSPTPGVVTSTPTLRPSKSPSTSPTKSPTKSPSVSPTLSQVTSMPTASPLPRLDPVEFTNEWIANYAEGDESPIHPEVSTIMNYQPRMPLPEDAFDLPTGCPHLETGLVDWDALSLPADDGNDITLPVDTSIIIREGQLTSSAESPYGRITIPSGSRLIFDGTGSIDMHTLGITVEGALEAGSATCRIDNNISITLHGEYGNTGVSDRHLSSEAAADMSIKGIFVKDVEGARIDIHGTLYHPTWSRLAAAVPGAVQVATSAPAVRNTELFLQDCVNWPDGGQVIVTTSHVKDTRGYNFNEEATIAPSGVKCVTIDGKSYGKVTLTTPLEHYHHAGEREYQCEVGLLTRNIVIQGNNISDPTDDSPLECDSPASGWTSVPCPGTFLTGLGGHTIVVGKGEGRLRGVEFFRMGMTNVMGRYPVHFHHHDPEAGQVSMMTDCSVHRSYFRAISIHNAFNLKVQRNTAFDITGHAFYLESGVEEQNRVEFNLAAFIHPIDGAQLMPSNVVGNVQQTDTILVPADHTASGFYVSNVHNYIIGNAASGGWSGMQFPVLPQPADKTLRFNGVVPKDRPSLLITGNSIHSSSWFAANSGAMYEGGSLYWEESDVDSETLIYNAGRVSSSRLTRYTKDENGNDDWFKVYNTTVWLANIGVTGWGKRAEINGFEVSDFQNRAIFVLFTVWMNSIVINCRTSNAPLVPDPGIRSYETLLNDGGSWSGFFTYDHLMKHILTNWKVSNCGADARGGADTGRSGFVTIPVNGLAPEVQIISSGMEYDFDTLGGEDFTHQGIFFGSNGAEDIYSMQYQSNWEDSDGSWTNRKVGTNTSTVMGPARAGAWWNLDKRPGKCEIRDSWKFPHQLCDKDGRHLASMFTVVMPQNNQQGSKVLSMLDSSANARKTRQGSMTHFGYVGDASIDACTPPEPCFETTSRSWDPDLTGPFNHAQYGGWYLSFDEGTPAHLTIQKVQMEAGSTMIQAMSLPPGTTSSNVQIYAESRSRTHDFSLAASLDEVRTSLDKYFLDQSTNTLYWRVIAGYVESDLSYDWIDRDAQGVTSFTREGLTVTDTSAKNQLQIHIKVDCETDTLTNAFCVEKPEFLVPDMGCPDDEVMVAIDQCGQPCELLEEGCETPPPTPSCVVCSDVATPWMIGEGYECATAPQWLINKKCNKANFWINNNYCEMRCDADGFGYHDESCCSLSA